MPAWASDLRTATSPCSVSETADRLEAAVNGAGATVLTRVDHGGSAASVARGLAPSGLLIFDNPELGTPALQDRITAGLDQPLRILICADANGLMHVTCRDPATLAASPVLPAEAEYIARMTGALDKLMGKAIAAD